MSDASRAAGPSADRLPCSPAASAPGPAAGLALDREAQAARLAEDLPVGGQAVIEGVMMRVPGSIVTAVRRADGSIAVREQPYVPLTRRWRWLGLPVVRGAVTFVEMLVIGMGALNWSASMAMEAPDVAAAPASPGSAWRDRLALAGTMVAALALGVGLFFFVPLATAHLLGVRRGAVQFNLVAGLVRALLLLLYMWGVSQWSEIRRVFQYHGAEHKSIFALEAQDELSPERARRYSRLHPRCGTSFMLIVVLVAVAVFSAVDALFAVVFGHAQSLLERFATHLAVLPVIGGASFELLKLSGRRRHHWLARLLSAPGLWLQRITTSEPDDSQLEVALTALRHALAAAQRQVEAGPAAPTAAASG